MCISKERALEVIKRSMAASQFKLRNDLSIALRGTRKESYSRLNEQLEENQAVLDLINLELMKFMDNPNTLN